MSTMNDFIKQMLEQDKSQDEILEAFTEVYKYEKEKHDEAVALAAKEEAEREKAEAAQREKDLVQDLYFNESYLSDSNIDELVKALAAAQADFILRLTFDTAKDLGCCPKSKSANLFEDWYSEYRSNCERLNKVVKTATTDLLQEMNDFLKIFKPVNKTSSFSTNDPEGKELKKSLKDIDEFFKSLNLSKPEKEDKEDKGSVKTFNRDRTFTVPLDKVKIYHDEDTLNWLFK